MNDWASIRTVLIDRRRALGFSQRELAKRIGTVQSSISDWESGKYQPQLDSLLGWAQALEIDIQILLHLRPVTIPGRTVRATLTQGPIVDETTAQPG